MKPNIKKRIIRKVSVRRNRTLHLLKKPTRNLPVKVDDNLTRIQRYWRDQGFGAGQKSAKSLKGSHRVIRKKVMNDAWVRWSQLQPGLTQTVNYLQACRGFVDGYTNALNKETKDYVLWPTVRSVGVVVTVSNGEKSIVKVLEQLKRLPLNELIVIVHGSKDRTLENIRQHSQAMIVHYPEAIGPDVGRAIGAKMSHSEILLFLEGDQVVSAERLLPFISDIEKGSDLALNNVTPYLPPFSQWDDVMVMKHFLNVSLNRPDLHANSLADVPHALSRQALKVVEHAELMVPPKAQVQAILAGLRITAPASVRPGTVSNVNKLKTSAINGTNIHLGIGDHVEALQKAMNAKGERIDFLDIIRKREIIEGESE